MVYDIGHIQVQFWRIGPVIYVIMMFLTELFWLWFLFRRVLGVI